MTILSTALSQFGVTEISGNKHNPTILKYFNEIGKQWITTDETAWCSAFINWVALKSSKEQSGELTARSWLKVGLKTKGPQPGDVVIFWRESKESWKGHVGLFISYSLDKKHIHCLGGNQKNQVNITAYPTSRLLGFRRLKTL